MPWIETGILVHRHCSKQWFLTKSTLRRDMKDAVKAMAVLSMLEAISCKRYSRDDKRSQNMQLHYSCLNRSYRKNFESGKQTW